MQRLSTLLNKFSDIGDGGLLIITLRGVYDRLSSQTIVSAALAQATTTTKVKVGAPLIAVASGVPIHIATASADNFWTLSGVVADGKTNAFLLFVDKAGAAQSMIGTDVTTVVAGQLPTTFRFPQLPEGMAMVGYVVVSCSGGAFTGGTSNVATAGNFTVTFVNTVGAIDPSAVI